MKRILLVLYTVLFSLPVLAQKAGQENSIQKIEGIWQRDTISEGYVYHSYSGYEPLSDSFQFVNVLEVDLNNKRYSIKFRYAKPHRITSKSMVETGAVGIINATFEPESVFIRVDGNTLYAIPNDYVMNTPVKQWKNDGAIYCDESGHKVKIESTGKGLNLEQTRRAYALKARRWENIFSSAPVLIDDFEPVGETFAEKGFSEDQIEKIHYEDPFRHQHVRHPRTAVATTADNHILLITVDGRWPGFADGMSACELTKFLARHFNPRYALNMDGGGSTTMGVAGHGDPATHIVNYPTDNKKFDHSGERYVITNICVIDNGSAE